MCFVWIILGGVVISLGMDGIYTVGLAESALNLQQNRGRDRFFVQRITVNETRNELLKLPQILALLSHCDGRDTQKKAKPAFVASLSLSSASTSSAVHRSSCETSSAVTPDRIRASHAALRLFNAPTGRGSLQPV